MRLVRTGLSARTEGLAGVGHPEVGVEVADHRLVKDAEEMLRWLTGYVVDRKARLRPGEALRWGFWSLRFLARGAGLILQEARLDGEGHVPGATFTLATARAQQETCRRFYSVYSPPFAEETALATPGVLVGARPLWAKRGTAAPPDSGWRMATDADGEAPPSEVPLRRIAAANPDLVPFLALVPGFEATFPDGGEPDCRYAG